MTTRSELAECVFSHVVECGIMSARDAHAALRRYAAEFFSGRDARLVEACANSAHVIRHSVRAARHWERYGNNPIAQRCTRRAYRAIFTAMRGIR